MGYESLVLHAEFDLPGLAAAGVEGGWQTLFAERAKRVNKECAGGKKTGEL